MSSTTNYNPFGPVNDRATAAKDRAEAAKADVEAAKTSADSHTTLLNEIITAAKDNSASDFPSALHTLLKDKSQFPTPSSE